MPDLWRLQFVCEDRLTERFVRRLRELEQQLADRRLEPRRHDEPIAVFVPTWRIETWIAHLCGKPGVTESTPMKLDRAPRHLWEKDSKSSIEHSVANWAKRQPSLPSLEHAYREAARVGLKGAS